MTVTAEHNPDDPRLRFRLWIDGELLDEAWIDSNDADADEQGTAVQRRHEQLAAEAEGYGYPWLIEVYDPAQPPDQAYIRFGTDRDGMTEPAELRDAPRALRDLFLPGDGP